MPNETLGLMIDWIGNDYTQTILDAAADYCRVHDRGLVVFTLGPLSHTLPAPALELQIRPFLEAPEIDRILVCNSQMVRDKGRESLERVFSRPLSKPLVFYGAPVGQWPTWRPCASTGFLALLEHLVKEHGYRRLAWVSGPDGNPDSQIREEIFRAFFVREGLCWDESLVVRGDFNLASGREAGRTLALRRAEFDAVVCGNDTMAMGVREVLGSEVPVTGIDNDSVALQLDLTTVDEQTAQQIKSALEILFHQFREGSCEERGGKLVIRSSCGCPTHSRPLESAPAKAEKFTERVGGLFERILECEDLTELSLELNPALATEGVEFWSLVPPQDLKEAPEPLPLNFSPRSGPPMAVVHSLFRDRDLFGYFIHDLSQRDYVFSEWLRLNICLLFSSWHRRHESVQVRKVLAVELEKFDRRRHEIESVIDSLPIWILETDRRLMVRYMNRELRRLLGLAEHQERLKPLSLFLAQDDREKVETRVLECLRSQNNLGLDFRFQTQARQEVPVIGEAQALPAGGSNLSTLFGSMHFDNGVRLTGILVRPLIDGVSQPERLILKHFSFSPGEQEVITWLARGLDTTQIAEQLGRSESTVRVQLHHIYLKTGVSKRREFLELLRDYRARNEPPHSLTQMLLARLFTSD